MEHVIEIPADVKTVKLELERNCAFTLRSLLPQVKDGVELVVEDVFAEDVCTGLGPDLYRLRAADGDSLLRKLTRSRVVEGESLLDLTPAVRFVDPVPTMLNGTLAVHSGTGCIQLTVTPPTPDEED